MEDYELTMCRICLVDDVRMCLIVNTHLQEVYEALTLMPLQAQDNRPVHVCYFCCAVLQNSYRLKKRSLQSEQLFTRVLSSGVLQPVNILQSSCTQRLRVVHPVIQLNMGGVVRNGTHDESADSADRTEAPAVVEDIKVEREDAEGANKIKLEIEDIILEENGRDTDGGSCCLSSQSTEEMKLEIEDIVLEDYGRQSDDAASLESADNVCPKIQNVVLERMVLNDTRTGTPVLKKHHLVTQKISTETTSSKHNRNDQAETTVAEDESKTHETIDKVDATLHKQTSGSNIYLNKKGFRLKSRLQCATRTRAGEKLFECDVCKKCFRLIGNLNVHMRIHTGEKLFECDVCKKCFRLRGGLKKHMRTHTGEKPFSCDVCKKCFREPDNLKIHIRTHTGEKPYMCDMCNKCFTRKAQLCRHISTHTKEETFSCDICDKCFRRKAYLDRHRRVHTDRKPHICNECNKCFTRISYLRCHMRIHTGEKPYVCDVCKKSFKHQSSLYKHTRTHTGSKPYTCDVCNKQFKFRYIMIRHKCTHNKTIIQPQTPISPLFLKSGLGY